MQVMSSEVKLSLFDSKSLHLPFRLQLLKCCFAELSFTLGSSVHNCHLVILVTLWLQGCCNVHTKREITCLYLSCAGYCMNHFPNVFVAHARAHTHKADLVLCSRPLLSAFKNGGRNGNRLRETKVDLSVVLTICMVALCDKNNWCQRPPGPHSINTLNYIALLQYCEVCKTILDRFHCTPRQLWCCSRLRVTQGRCYAFIGPLSPSMRHALTIFLHPTSCVALLLHLLWRLPFLTLLHFLRQFP